MFWSRSDLCDVGHNKWGRLSWDVLFFSNLGSKYICSDSKKVKRFFVKKYIIILVGFLLPSCAQKQASYEDFQVLSTSSNKSAK